MHWSWDADYNTRDLADLQPMEGWAIPESSCNQASQATEMSSVEDYESGLSVDVSAEAGYDGAVGSASFKASVGTSNFQKDVVEKESERFEMKSMCIRFWGSLKKGNFKIPPTKYFKERAKQGSAQKSRPLRAPITSNAATSTTRAARPSFICMNENWNGERKENDAGLFPIRHEASGL